MPKDWERWVDKVGNPEQFIYVSITKLDETILNRLIDKIYISAVEVIDGEKVQKVRIIYNFVGEIANQMLLSVAPFPIAGERALVV